MVNNHLIDTGDIATILGVSRAHVTDRLTKLPTFPAPVVNISQRLRRWDRDQVMTWLCGRVEPQLKPQSRGSRSTERV